MKTSGEIISYLESELSEANKQYNHWKDIDRSEAMKHRIKANELEIILDNIDPTGEPEEKKPKRTFLRIYLNVFFLVVYFTSMFAVGRFISDLLERLSITGLAASLLLYGYYLLHTISAIMMFAHQDLIFTKEKVYKGER